MAFDLNRVFLGLLLLSARAYSAPNEILARVLLNQLEKRAQSTEVVASLVVQASEPGWQDLGLLSRCLIRLGENGKLIRFPLALPAPEPLAERSLEYLIRDWCLKIKLFKVSSVAAEVQRFLTEPSTPEQRIQILDFLRWHLIGSSPSTALLPSGRKGHPNLDWEEAASVQRGYFNPPQAQAVAMARMAVRWDHSAQVRETAQLFLNAFEGAFQKQLRISDPDLSMLGQSMWKNMNERAEYIVAAVEKLVDLNGRAIPLTSCLDNLARSVGGLFVSGDQPPPFVDVRRILGPKGKYN